VDLFKHPTIRQLAHRLSSDTTPDTTVEKGVSRKQSSSENHKPIGVDNQAKLINLVQATLIPLHVSGDQQPFFCIPGLGSNATDLYKLAQIVGKERPVYGFQAMGLDGQNKPQQPGDSAMLPFFHISILPASPQR